MSSSAKLLWPAFVRPKDDELLSSWLLRNVHAHQMKAHPFCKVMWPHLAFWNRDIDRMAHPEVWRMMAEKTETDFERSYRTTLAAYEGLLFKQAFSHGHTQWILPLGIYHRTYTHYGMQFCPSCLRKDGQGPYYRRWWRLALAIGCPVCGCQLMDECPFCKQPVMFHRNEIGRKNELAASPLSCCTGCSADFADLRTEALPPALVGLQQQWHRLLSASAEGGENQHEYFDVLHQILMLLNSRRPVLTRFQRAVADGSGITFYKPTGGFTGRIEVLRLYGRYRIIGQAAWLLEEWPSRLLDAIRHTDTRLSAILSEKQNLPASFITLVLSLSK